MKLTGMVMVHNNESTILKCIHSMKKIIDELIIIDDYSTDNTIKLIKKEYPKAKIYQRKLDKDFASQRNFGLSKSNNEWVLFIDSDEQITSKLAKQIRQELKNPKYNAYISRRDNQMMDTFFKSNSGRPILLKKKLRFKNRLHEQIYNTKFGYLSESLTHYSWSSVTDWVQDLNNYSGFNASKWVHEKRNFNAVQLLLISLGLPVWIFIKMYFIQGRWRHGYKALIYCFATQAEWPFSVLKYLELRKK